MPDLDAAIEALAAFRHASGMLTDPAPDYLDPQHRAAILREITTWYAGREGGGPWCWKCGKAAVCRRRELSGSPSYWCAECSKVAGVFHPLDGDPLHADSAAPDGAGLRRRS